MAKHKINLPNPAAKYNAMRQPLVAINSALDAREEVYLNMGLDKLRQIVKADKILDDGLVPLYKRMRAIFGRAIDG
jgi:hypothetical protein